MAPVWLVILFWSGSVHGGTAMQSLPMKTFADCQKSRDMLMAQLKTSPVSKSKALNSFCISGSELPAAPAQAATES